MARRRRYGGYGFAEYVPMARRRLLALRETQRASARGKPLDPVVIEGRQIASTPWGLAWCDHIESFRDYANRLPRGRTYVRNGSVYHLAIDKGRIRARVMGSRDYEQRVVITPCKSAAWKRVRRHCAGGIGSLIELLEGRISSAVMAAMTAEKDGLLPDLKHVELHCSCPDWAHLCKHLAAVLYGVGARLDERPELLFTLRGVDPAELVDGATLPGEETKAAGGARTLEGDLSAVFGIELDEEVPVPRPKREPKKRSGSKVRRQELLDAGVPPGTIATWLSNGVLEPSDERGVYRHTRESRERMERYAE